MNWIDFLAPGFLTPGALLAVGVILILTGKLVPVYRVRRMEAENDHLRKTVESLTASVSVYAKAAEVQVQTAAITESVMKALQQQAKDSNVVE